MTPPHRRPELPLFLQRRHTDEFLPAPYTSRERRAIAGVVVRGKRDAARLGMALGDYWSSRSGTAAGLRRRLKFYHADFAADQRRIRYGFEAFRHDFFTMLIW